MKEEEIMESTEHRGCASCGGRTVHHCVDGRDDGLRSYTHPRQGSAMDCSVIAALTSIQAVNSGRLSGSYPTYRFKSGTITLTSRRIPVDSAGNIVYANSTSTAVNRYWPMYWEKAFAKLLSNAECPKPATCPYRTTCSGEPDIGGIFSAGYAGSTALMEIGRYRDFVQGSLSIDSIGHMTAPAIGTTKSTIVEDTFWKRNHDYSILGFDPANRRYLIRNPCGSVDIQKYVPENEFQVGSPHFAVWGHVTNPL